MYNRFFNIGAVQASGNDTVLYCHPDFHCLNAKAESLRAGSLPIFGPAQPAYFIAVYPVPDIIILSRFSGKLNLKRLNGLRLAGRSGCSSIRHRILPANVADMCPILNPHSIHSGNRSLQGLNGKFLAGSA